MLKFKQGFRNTLNFFIHAFLFFYKDKLHIRANAIAYSIIVAIIPLLTVLIRIANIQQEELLKQINQIFSLYGIVGVQPILDIIQDILNRANTISGIGILFLIYSSLNIFQHLEESANQIFKSTSRGFLVRTSIFTTWLIFIPAVLIFLFEFSKRVEGFFKPPNYIQITYSKNFYTLTEKKTIEVFNENFEFIESINFLEKVDFLVLNRRIIINDEPFDYDLTGDFIKSLLKKPVGFFVQNDFILVSYQPAFLFFSFDGGLNWDFRYFLFSHKGKTYEFPIIEDIAFYKNQIFVLLTTGKQSYFLVMDKNFFEIKNKLVFETYFNKIFFYNDDVYLSSKGSFLVIDINKWSMKNFTIPQFSNLIENAYFFKEHVLLLSQTKRVAFWEKEKIHYPLIRINQLENIKGMKFFSDGTGFLYGLKEIRFSLNQGKDWYLAKFYDSNEKEVSLSSINDVYHYKQNFVFIGEQNSWYKAQVFSITIDPKSDLPLIKFRVLKYYEPSKEKLLLPKIVLIILNYFYVVIVFTFFYLILPNKKIRFVSAFLGGLVGATGVVLFMSIFQLIIPLFSSTYFVYGIWFSIPIGLLILLASIQIFLFGLEVTRVHMTKVYQRFDAMGKLKIL
ncbi:MAG: YihY/virulence factor BrkB family protein [Leptospiraceae bacterium]|nr:YihY/virulence factor BrkB family protein [Leptospiraceae bacterium]MDW7975533.1 YhjD/YihY/BrkB family envelope integrity protein [Leptospiraceae bacterium]